MKVEQKINISVPSEIVFSYLMDVKNRNDYIPSLEEVIMIDPLPIRLGSRYIEVANIGGRRLKTTYQVIYFEENKQISAKTLESVFPIKADMIINERGSSSELLINLDFQLKGIFALVSGIIRGIVIKQAKGILINIKRNMEEQYKSNKLN